MGVFSVYAHVMEQEEFTLSEWAELSNHQEFWDYLYCHNFYAANKCANNILLTNKEQNVSTLLYLCGRDFYDKKSNNVIIYHNDKPHGVFYSKWLKELRKSAVGAKSICIKAVQGAQKKLLNPKSKKGRIKKQKKDISSIVGKKVSATYCNKFFKPPGGKISGGVIFTPKEKVMEDEK